MNKLRKTSHLQAPGALRLEHSTAHWVKVAHRAFQQLLQAKLAPHGIKLSHWHCLRYLSEEDGLTQRELSRRVHVLESTTVAVIKEMESRELIRRKRDDTDRRKSVVLLTAKGRRITHDLLPIARAVNELGAADFSAAEVQLYRTLTRRIITNLTASLPEDGRRAPDAPRPRHRPGAGARKS